MGTKVKFRVSHLRLPDIILTLSFRDAVVPQRLSVYDKVVNLLM